MEPLLAFVRRRWKPLLGVAVGAGLGAAYAHFVGCGAGGCPLTSNPLIAAPLGGLLGWSLTGWGSSGSDDEGNRR
ncbi:MAG: hypothetical protein JRG91_01480 [Deltaproteobacteria bacterium]|nr:hypothetical protein [Deltaproteobacteria bacterium]